MSILSALVLYAVIWFLTLMIVIPIRLETQGDAGEIVPGTHAGSPTNPQMKKRALITSGVAFVIWVIACAVILSGMITVQDLDMFSRMSG